MDTTHASEAFHSGARVGRMGLSPSLNPHKPNDTLHLDWHRGWQEGNRARVQERAEEQRAA